MKSVANRRPEATTVTDAGPRKRKRFEAAAPLTWRDTARHNPLRARAWGKSQSAFSVRDVWLAARTHVEKRGRWGGGVSDRPCQPRRKGQLRPRPGRDRKGGGGKQVSRPKKKKEAVGRCRPAAKEGPGARAGFRKLTSGPSGFDRQGSEGPGPATTELKKEHTGWGWVGPPRKTPTIRRCLRRTGRAFCSDSWRPCGLTVRLVFTRGAGARLWRYRGSGFFVICLGCGDRSRHNVHCRFGRFRTPGFFWARGRPRPGWDEKDVRPRIPQTWP